MSKKVGGLGRGLSALLDEAVRPNRDDRAEGESADTSKGVRDLEIGRIRPNPYQPRRHFDETALGELATSISARGVLQPILVRPVDDGFELIAGERRWRAAQLAHLHKIPAIVREMDDRASAEIALIENIQREDLNVIEEAEGLRRLVVEHGHSQEQVGQLVNKSRSHVANLLRLLDLPDSVKQLLLRNDINMGHARALVGSADAAQLAAEAARDGLSVREVERRVREGKSAKSKVAAPPRPSGPADADLAALERQLGDMLGLKVRIQHGKNGGQVQLAYSSLDQLDLICQRLSGEPI